MSKLTISFLKGLLVSCFAAANQGIEFNPKISLAELACFLQLDLH